MGIYAEMYVVVPNTITDGQITDMSEALCNAFGRNMFLQPVDDDDLHTNWQPLERTPDGIRDKILRICQQDPETETVLTVNLDAIYYSTSYQRGDIGSFYLMGRWFEARLPCIVLYGGDSYEEGDEDFPSPFNLEKAFKHWAEQGNGPMLQYLERQA